MFREPIRGHIRLVVIQATSFCNIDCKYCYLANRSVNKAVSHEVLTDIQQWLNRSQRLSPTLTISWHAGEPLILASSFFEAAFQLFSSDLLPVKHVQHSVQTNGTLVSSEHCKVFKAFSTNVGVSLDGPRHIHDRNRVTRHGHGTFDKVVEGVKRLQDYGIPVSVIAVVGEQTFDEPDAFYQFFAELGIPVVGINVQEIEGVNSASYIGEDRYLAKYKSFLKRVFYLSCSDGRVGIRELMQSLVGIRGGREQHSSEAEPFYIMSFTSGGDYSTFSPELLDQVSERYGSFQFGNVRTDTFDDLTKNKGFLIVAGDIAQGVIKCSKECSYFRVCGGGAPANKLGEHGGFAYTQTAYCRFTKMANHDVILDLFDEHPNLVGSLANTSWWTREFR